MAESTVLAHVYAVLNVPRHPGHPKIAGRLQRLGPGRRRDAVPEKCTRNCGEMLALATWPPFAAGMEKGQSKKNSILYPSRDEDDSR
jgi:hypothetical protein